MDLGTPLQQRLRRLFALPVVLALAGCGMPRDHQDNVALAERYFAAIDRGDVDSALGYYSERFFTVTSRADWERALTDLSQHCGAIKAHTLITWNTSTIVGTNAGSRSNLIYRVKYSECEVTEALTVFKPSGGSPQIIAHTIKPGRQVPQPSGTPAQTV